LKLNNILNLLLQKNSIEFIVLGIIIILSGCNYSGQKNIYGNWKGKFFENSAHFTFNHDSTCTIKVFSSNGSKPFEINGLFDVNFYKNPITINITNIKEQDYNLYSILELDNNLLIIAYFSTKWKLRPISFQPQKTMLLKRDSKL